MKRIVYKFNISTIPKRLEEPEVAKAFISFIMVFQLQWGLIEQETYDKLADWQKVYWEGIEVEETL